MSNILGAEFNDLSVEQKNDIKYKKYTKPIKITKLKYPEINNGSNFFRKIGNLSERKSLNKNRYLEFPFL